MPIIPSLWMWMLCIEHIFYWIWYNHIGRTSYFYVRKPVLTSHKYIHLEQYHLMKYVYILNICISCMHLPLAVFSVRTLSDRIYVYTSMFDVRACVYIPNMISIYCASFRLVNNCTMQMQIKFSLVVECNQTYNAHTNVECNSQK